MTPDYTQEDVLAELGLDQMPPARLPGLEQKKIAGGGMLKWKKAVQLIDPIETAAFMRYAPDDIPFDQSLDPIPFSPDHSRALSIRTDVPIPMHPKIAKATGMTAEPTAQNHYIWLWIEVDRHLIELGAKAVSPVKIFRTSGAEGTWPLLGALFKLSFAVPDGLARADIGANWGVLSDRRTPEIHVDE